MVLEAFNKSRTSVARAVYVPSHGGWLVKGHVTNNVKRAVARVVGTYRAWGFEIRNNTNALVSGYAADDMSGEELILTLAGQLEQGARFLE